MFENEQCDRLRLRDISTFGLFYFAAAKARCIVYAAVACLALLGFAAVIAHAYSLEREGRLEQAQNWTWWMLAALCAACFAAFVSGRAHSAVKFISLVAF